MKITNIITALLLAIPATRATPLANPDSAFPGPRAAGTESGENMAAPLNSGEGGGNRRDSPPLPLQKRKACRLVRPDPELGRIPCYAGAGTRFPRVAVLQVGYSATVRCKTLGENYKGESLWDRVVAPSGANCFVSSFHVQNGCDDSVIWC
ncbi:hypothetical protein Micbo1qcDRAFT_219862 [Microdochium bolleyi]|uniref:Ig-like domain-containing protein n=1 Tax=Microdochium bolleyi TaxID=196109 RepID=A0A136IMJ0_9PEZI|nr:hypothetical protein Micbo1qcDRAFT_219862 [Microdochium bolleyi]